MKDKFRFSAPYKTIFKKTSPYLEQHPLIRLKKGEPLLVGVSGGQDSLALLHFLALHPLCFTIIPCLADYGFQKEKEILSLACVRLGLELHLIPATRGKNCYECSRLRKQALFEYALQQGIRVIILGHHGDDLLESFFISLLYGGEVHTFCPVESFHGSFLLARPFSGLLKEEVAAYSRSTRLPLLAESSCLRAAGGKREEVRRLLHAFSKDQKRRILSTLLRSFQQEEDAGSF